MAALVLVEHDGKNIKTATLSAIAAAAQLTQDISLLVIGHHCQEVALKVSKIPDIQSVFIADHSVYAAQLPENLAELIATFGQSYSCILAAATAFGKSLMPRVAALLDVAQVSDVTGIVDANTFVRPIYAGSAFETLRLLEPIQVLTIRPTAFELVQNFTNAVPFESASIIALDMVIPNVHSQKISMTESANDLSDLGSASIVIAGGRGLQSAENFHLLNEIAHLLDGAAVGASRAAVDAGYVPNDRQIGQTGKMVAPRLYIAVGISGAIQHVAGIKDSQVIVAINKDPDAPIFQVADYGLVGDLFTILPELKQALSVRKK